MSNILLMEDAISPLSKTRNLNLFISMICKMNVDRLWMSMHEVWKAV